jgi:hypothetical protein
MAKKQTKKRKINTSAEDVKHLFGLGKIPRERFVLDEMPMLIHPESFEEVVHPKHYNALPNGIECWDVTEHFPANVAMGMKHLWRVGKKPGQDAVKDLKKAIEYTQRQIKLLEGKTPKMQK